MAVTGSGATLQIGKESAWGTAAAGAKIIDFTSESIKLAPDKKVQDSLIASKAAPAKDLMGLLAQGDTAFVLRPEYAGFLFKAMLGGTDTVAAGSPVAGANTHTIPLADANGVLPSYTLIIDRKAAVKKYAGCKVSSWSLDAKVGDYVKGSISWMGKDESVGSLAALSPLALQAFKVVSATCTIGGTSYDVKSVSLKGDNKLEDVGQTFTSGLYHLEPIHGQRELTVDVEMNYDSAVETLHDNYSITGNGHQLHRYRAQIAVHCHRLDTVSGNANHQQRIGDCRARHFWHRACDCQTVRISDQCRRYRAGNSGYHRRNIDGLLMS